MLAVLLFTCALFSNTLCGKKFLVEKNALSAAMNAWYVHINNADSNQK